MGSVFVNVVDLKLGTLDGRYKAFPKFRFVVQPSNPRLSSSNIDQLVRYQSVRAWAIDTWGPSCELDLWIIFERQAKELINLHWCYDVSDQNGSQIMRLYFRGEEELALYHLRWS